MADQHEPAGPPPDDAGAAAAPTTPEEADLPPFIIEGARSSRSRCKTCRKKIEKGSLRLGIFVSGAFGAGHMWHHLKCAAKRRFDDVEAAYAEEAWKHAKEPPEDVPSLDELRGLHDEAEKTRKERKTIPYIEVAPSARSKCVQCGQPIEKDALRVILGREVSFGSQIRTSPIKVHPQCVEAALDEPDCATEAEDLEAQLRANSGDLSSAQIDSVIAQLGATE